jgi:hypothetical protein
MCGACSPTLPLPLPQPAPRRAYITRVAVNAPGLTSVLHELRDLAKVTRKSSAKTYTCQSFSVSFGLHMVAVHFITTIESNLFTVVTRWNATKTCVLHGGILTITRHDCIFTKCTFSWNASVTSYKQDYYQGHSRTSE